MSDIDPRLISWPDSPVAVVIGAGGMGTAVAKRLGQHSKLVVADLNQEKLDSIREELTDSGYAITTVQCDVTDRLSVMALAEVIKKQGGFRTLAHVAGLSPSMADGKTIMAVNLMGTALVAEILLPLAKKNTAAIFVSSLAGHMASPSEEVIKILSKPLIDGFMDRLLTALDEELTPTLSYLLSKNALIKMCQYLSPAWGMAGARIISISPGLIATPMGMLEFENQPQKFDLLAKTPLGRQGNMHEIADAIDFLSSDRASFITGTDLLVDGGIHAALLNNSQ